MCVRREHVALNVTSDGQDLQLAISANGSTLAYVTDIGTVGTVDITTRRTSKMNSAHGNVRSLQVQLLFYDFTHSNCT
jgi:hypothetical protein